MAPRKPNARQRKQSYSSSSSSNEEEPSSSEEESIEESSSEEEEEYDHNASSSEESSEASDYEEEEEESLDLPLHDLIDAVIDYEDPNEGWDIVREWLRTHSATETKQAIETKGEYDTTALHVACRNVPPKDVVDIVLMAAPDMIFWADSFGWLPLHYACANGASLDVVKLLIEAYEDSKLTTDKRGRTPLHFALGNVEVPATAALVKLLTGITMKRGKSSGEAAKWPDENDMLPIHYACAYGASVEVLDVLVDAWEDSLTKTDSKGRTALHFAMGNSVRPNSPGLVERLVELSPSSVNTMDSEKHLPLHLLSTKAEAVPETKVEQIDNIQKCLDIYLQSEPSATTEFLTAVQNMPEEFRDVAVIHPTIQTMLNTKISSRFPTMVLMLDFYFLAGIIASFSITSLESIDRRFNELNTTNEDRSVSGALLSPLYIGALYFLLREITQFISVRAQTTVIAYVLDPENMLNLSFVFLTIYFSILMQTGLGNDDRFRTGAAFTIAACWLQLLAYLKSILIDFAVFVSGVIFVVKRLVAFMICLFIIIVAFAQMWYTTFRQSTECESTYEEMAAAEVHAAAAAAEGGNSTSGGGDSSGVDEPVNGDNLYYYYYYDDDLIPNEEEVEDCEPSIDYPYCVNMWWSIYKTYTLMLGDDDSMFRWDWVSTALFYLFYFLVTILLLNILIAVITDLNSIVTNDRAAIIFWGNRLAFITDMDLVTNGPWKKQIQKFFMLGNDDEDEEEALINKDKVEISWERILWKKLTECFGPEVGSSGAGMVFYIPMRFFISMFLIPFWLLLGILSAGWLWPPQVREGLFVQKVSVPEDSGQAQEAEERTEELQNIRNDLAEAKENLMEEYLRDRKMKLQLKNQVKDVKRELNSEMKNIKRVMTSLFEVKQKAMLS